MQIRKVSTSRSPQRSSLDHGTQGQLPTLGITSQCFHHLYNHWSAQISPTLPLPLPCFPLALSAEKLVLPHGCSLFPYRGMGGLAPVACGCISPQNNTPKSAIWHALSYIIIYCPISEITMKDFRFLEGTSWRGWVSGIPELPLPPRAQDFMLETLKIRHTEIPVALQNLSQALNQTLI